MPPIFEDADIMSGSRPASDMSCRSTTTPRNQFSAAVVHGLLGAFVWGLVGWTAFLFMVVVLALIVLLLMTYDSPASPTDAVPPAAPGPGNDGGSDDGGREDGSKDQGGSSPVTAPPAPTTP